MNKKLEGKLKKESSKGFKKYKFRTFDYTYLSRLAWLTKNPTGVLLHPVIEDDHWDFEFATYHIAVAGKKETPPLDCNIVVYVPIDAKIERLEGRKYFTKVLGFEIE